MNGRFYLTPPMGFQNGSTGADRRIDRPSLEVDHINNEKRLMAQISYPFIVPWLRQGDILRPFLGRSTGLQMGTDPC